MSVEDFYLEIRSGILPGTNEVAVTAASGNMKSQFHVSLPDFEDALNNVEDYLCDRFMKTFDARAFNAHDAGEITDEEWETFKKVMKVIEW
jgi:hypothetical protein